MMQFIVNLIVIMSNYFQFIYLVFLTCPSLGNIFKSVLPTVMFYFLTTNEEIYNHGSLVLRKKRLHDMKQGFSETWK